MLPQHKFHCFLIAMLLIGASTQLHNLHMRYPYLDKISQPVIGIVAIPTSTKLKTNLGAEYEAYVPSSYKKWIEQTGARPVVIPYFLSKTQIKGIINQINGILFIGGAPELILNGKPTPIMKKLWFIYQEALAQNHGKVKFPIWGTCLGFEAIVYGNSNYNIKTTQINTLNQNKKIHWEKQNYVGSQFEEELRLSVADALSKHPLSYFAHHWGFQVKDFEKIKELKENFKVIGYYKKNNMKIVSAIEHKTLPIVGVQFHPEKILFEHKAKVKVQLTRDSARASQELSRILFDNALENNNRFKSRAELERLEFKNFNDKKSMTVFETIYIFKKKTFEQKMLLKPATLTKIN